MSKNEAAVKSVGEINGAFLIPRYQRGYRWRENDVKRLLDDIFRCKENEKYCLQPISVRKTGDNSYNLIDGQQRLTTLYIIYRFLDKEPGFSISYETRSKSEDFLKNIKEKSSTEERENNIDFWFMSEAYDAVRSWFKEHKNAEGTILSRLSNNIRVIWYEVDEKEDEIALFSRINKGRIPLTNAELVKALFLNVNNSRNGIPVERQKEIALLWDRMERELNDDSFWYFLTDKTYQTRIDLLLNLIADRADKDDEYATFNYFKDLSEKDNGLEETWSEIYRSFLILKGWYENNNLYHWIGYLITTSGHGELKEIWKIAKDKKKAEFEKAIKNRIKEKLHTTVADLGKLEYDSDYPLIKDILILFNVETIRKKGQDSFRFPFDRYKVDKNGKRVKWTLEHIHAQQSLDLDNPNDRKEWLILHREYVAKADGGFDLASDIDDAVKAEKEMEKEEYKRLKDRVLTLLSETGKFENVHSIYNLALLSGEVNSALNNSVFAVKRDKIVDSIKKGEYVPYCTELVFLKCYTPSMDNQIYAWTEKDREAYKKEIDEVLGTFLQEEAK